MPGEEKGKHLTLEERKIIETGIQHGSTKTAIALNIGKDNSTIGKEIKEHRTLKAKCPLPLECAAYRHCKLGRDCKISCPKYEPFKCTRRDRSPGACNGCSNYNKCRFDKYWYDAACAQSAYETELVDSRQGVDLTTSEAKAIAEVVGPLLRQGISPYAIIHAHPELDICERTLYNYIESDILKSFGVDVFALRRQLSRKMPRKKAAQYKKRKDNRYLAGREYKDYKTYMTDNPNAHVVQMDTVYNDVSNGPFMQTFKFIMLPFFFAVFHEEKTAASMLAGVDLLETILGPELFNKYVEVILTDRGSEFSAADAIEMRDDGTRRTRLFFCDPMRSCQKGAIENNHIELRYILPGECDLRGIGLTGQNALNLCCSHINSFPKEKLQGKTNFECLRFFAPDLFERFISFGLSVIPVDQVILKPRLLKSFIQA